ncbi:ATP-binding protein [Bifidobacterium sp. ESL0790]|uniref:ATP-binding protein n=1 Tax=Bifidobacterium sp. ESL0790 TaxID=2983233 RepID=UPI0023F9FD19|nr:ATP-binding protein [Bifidobacterium sp. ESL0790]WEV73079.1 ATP-binding protein [Bifidobacterium sp. ESL0790]
MRNLKAWKNDSHHSPLVLCGARQVGKTYILKKFGKSEYQSCAYVNLMEDTAKNVFSAGYDAKRVMENIGILTQQSIVPGKTLVIIDEIQEVPSAMTLMKAFREEMPEQDIVAAGSYLGITLHAGVSFPVGKVEMLDMYPMTFMEFLHACGEQLLAEAVERLDFEKIMPFSKRLERYLRQYYFVGGMPEAVERFISGDGHEDYEAARKIQMRLLDAYNADFSKHVSDPTEAERIRLAFDSIPAHLGRENHKFVFGHIAPGARARQFETSIQWIIDSGLANRVYRVDKLVKPLKFYRDLSAFKLYLHDVGLLGATMHIKARDLLLSNTALEEYKGAMTEQYVCQQLVANGVSPYYWTAGDSRPGEVDFIIEHEGVVAPLEAKAEENLRAKSLKSLCSRTGLHGYRTSMSGYREQDWMTNIPLWAVGPYFAESTAQF